MNEIIDFCYLDIGKDPLNDLNHSHGASYEILFVRKGQGNLVLKNQLFNLREGAVYFINGMDTHCTVPTIPDEYIRSKIIIRSSIIDRFAQNINCTEIVDSLFSGGSCFLPNEQEAAYIDELFCAIDRTLKNETLYSDLKISVNILSILMTGYKKPCSDLLTDDTAMTAVLNYINKHISKRITLNDICDHCHLSKYYLCHEFRKKLGMTVFEYIISQRLTLSKKLLLESNKCISQICNEVGFSDFSYYSKAFKQHYGSTPKEFRNKEKTNV